MSADLLPCPFCGGACEVVKGTAVQHVWPAGSFYRAFCTACQVRELFHETESEAIAAWNRRAPVQAQGVALTDAAWAIINIAMDDAIVHVCDRDNAEVKIAACAPEIQVLYRALLAQAKPADHIEDSRQMVGADDARDAARYRFLKSVGFEHGCPHNFGVEPIFRVEFTTKDYGRNPKENSIDAAIDAAIATLGSAK